MIRVKPKVELCKNCSNEIEYEEQDICFYLENIVVAKRFPAVRKVFHITCPVCGNTINLGYGKPEPKPLF